MAATQTFIESHDLYGAATAAIEGVADNDDREFLEDNDVDPDDVCMAYVMQVVEADYADGLADYEYDRRAA